MTVRTVSKPLLFCTATVLFSLFSGCYYTAQSYNHGKLLDPGNSMFTLGIGRTFQKTKIEKYNYDYSYNYDSTYNPYTTTYEQQLWKNIALNYRLGITDVHPFGGGIEMGLHYEGSFFRDTYGFDVRTFPALDLDLRLGFKDIPSAKALYQHNLELGWTTGLWLDNGFFLGYAGGLEFEKVMPYAGIRAIIMPTNLLEHDDWPGDDDFFVKHDQKFNLRLTTGVALKLRKIKVLPDYISPEFTLTGPNGSEYEPVNGNFHVGFRWTNGL